MGGCLLCGSPGWRKADLADDVAVALIGVEEIVGGIGLDPEQEWSTFVESLIEQGEGFVMLAKHGVESGERHWGYTPGSRLRLQVGQLAANHGAVSTALKCVLRSSSQLRVVFSSEFAGEHFDGLLIHALPVITIRKISEHIGRCGKVLEA